MWSKVTNNLFACYMILKCLLQQRVSSLYSILYMERKSREHRFVMIATPLLRDVVEATWATFYFFLSSLFQIRWWEWSTSRSMLMGYVRRCWRKQVSMWEEVRGREEGDGWVSQSWISTIPCQVKTSITLHITIVGMSITLQNQCPYSVIREKFQNLCPYSMIREKSSLVNQV